MVILKSNYPVEMHTLKEKCESQKQIIWNFAKNELGRYFCKILTLCIFLALNFNGKTTLAYFHLIKWLYNQNQQDHDDNASNK
jgi:hypothetical protein